MDPQALFGTPVHASAPQPAPPNPWCLVRASCPSPSQAVQPSRWSGRVLGVLSTSCCPRARSKQPPPHLPPQFSRPRTRRAGSQTCPAPSKVEGVSMAPERELGGVLRREKAGGGSVTSPPRPRPQISALSPSLAFEGLSSPLVPKVPLQLLQPLDVRWGIYSSQRKRPAISWRPRVMSPSRRAAGEF